MSLQQAISRSRGRYTTKLNSSKKPTELPLTSDEKEFLNTHFEDYKKILYQWVKQENNKYDLSQKSQTFPMLTLPTIKPINQTKTVLYGIPLSYKKENDPEDTIKIEEKHIIYNEWQKLINRIIIRLKNGL